MLSDKDKQMENDKRIIEIRKRLGQKPSDDQAKLLKSLPDMQNEAEFVESFSEEDTQEISGD